MKDLRGSRASTPVADMEEIAEAALKLQLSPVGRRSRSLDVNTSMRLRMRRADR